ncbi:ABC transporter ATP-binding protein [Candidatus Woesearchaeota archaeon]|nr:ABC transporter ATP-binding protein [Candidatus Woesearchaeota archaeon]
MLEVKDLTRTFKKFTAVDHLSFSVQQGEIFGILGPNGAGKSTLMKMLTGFLEPTSGTATVAGVEIRDKEKLKRVIGWAPQEDCFYGKLSIVENLQYFGSLYGVEDIEKRIWELVQALGLVDKRNALAESLSGGMKRRLNIALAIVHSPKILFLDEPTLGIDPISRMALWDVIKDIKKQKITIIYSTHYLTEVEQLCDRMIILRRGRVVKEATPQSIKKYGKTIEEAFFNILKNETDERTPDAV